MNEIICPHCSKAFKIDEAGYADILKQVHDKEFEKQLHERLEAASLERQTALGLAEVKAMGELEKITAKKNGEIQTLKAKLEAGELAQKHAVADALNKVERERDALQAALQAKDMAQQIAVNDAVSVVGCNY